MGVDSGTMRLFSILSLAVAALAQDYEYDELGNKKNNIDKGPRWCGGKHNQVDSGHLTFKSKHPNLTKRCKIKCKKKGRMDNGPKRMFCDERIGWIERKDSTKPIVISSIMCNP